MALSAPRTRDAAAIRMKQIALDNQSCKIRRLRAQLATARRELDIITEEHKANQIALEASHMTIAGLTEIGLSMSKKIERMKAKKQKARESHVACHQKFQARIQEAEDSMQAQHLIIEALVEEKDSLLQTIQGLQEANDAQDSMQAQHLIIEALVEEKDSLLQTIQGLQEANDAPTQFDDEWEEEPEEHPEEEEIPIGEGEIDDE
ncbi:hypothetical protein F511_14398 [Dorcoceras hygrometricum]|uniref:Uncharacterized protein n=1 Tax=Dorcoceras hygrometricum TaxID=472368 RepID=A0A2Z7BWU5_9LAMI|nr:hypothetical protein F511_14398 [Dorcoceras hygrometricum]